MGRQQLIILAIAVLAALLGVAFFGGDFGGGPKQIQVLVAQDDIAAHTFVGADQIAFGIVDTETHPGATPLGADQVVGRISRVEIQEGEPISPGMLYSGTAGLEHVIPSGQRAMSIPINQPESELKLFKPGSRIDIIATVQERRGQFRTGIILENVLLLAKEMSDGRNRSASISFIVSVGPKGAEKLALAVSHGEMRVALRHNTDDTVIDSTGVSINDLITGMDAGDDPESLYVDTFEPGSMEVIRGIRKTTDHFEDGSSVRGTTARLIQRE